MVWLMAALLAAQDLSKDDVLRLSKDGKSDAEILRAIGPTTFRLTVEEIVELKKAGVSEKVLARMVAGPSEIAVTNRAHKAVRIRVRGETIEVGVGEELPPGASLQLPGAGEFGITVNGYSRTARVKTPATLTFRGCDLEKFEVVTLYIEGPGIDDTCLVENRVKAVEQPQAPADVPPPRVAVAGRYPRGLLERTVDWVGTLPGRVSDVFFGGW